ncbi:hypothetical protein GCM10010306_012500 [Streptomyces umbrinus]|uniref:hypothetical protein n=1 Tax=Streptomyces umbrinus TaxID=67370 RepID=UPI0019CD8B29|nr:hypothetical protein [Streptomyces umbrinus]GHB21390.1 hypothetical protein GCM10010306_012500 [Streptomyces umbrinus]
MTTTPRQRFTVRAGLAEAVDDDAPYDGVPDHLGRPLREWVEAVLRPDMPIEQTVVAEAVALRLRITVPARYSTAAYLCQAIDDDLLDVVDELLLVLAEASRKDAKSLLNLGFILEQGGSAYRINAGEDGLEVRITPAVRDAVNRTVTEAAAVSSAGSAADHLAAAWKAVYGRQPDPSRAYSEAIKAVECVAHAVIQPNHAKATLGTMLGEIGNARAKFTTALATPVGKDPIAPAEAMMRALWDGQTSRHGKKTATVPETLEAARTGVHLAATLVQWFSSGAVVRTP